MAELSADLARRIKAQRMRLNLSQVEAAERMGVSVRTLQSWEAGKNFPRPRHRRVIDTFLAA